VELGGSADLSRAEAGRRSTTTTGARVRERANERLARQARHAWRGQATQEDEVRPASRASGQCGRGQHGQVRGFKCICIGL
jgi:hypothetical protein